LTARPNVSSGATRFAFGRTLDHAAKVTVFDVGGRLVRTLNARAGEASVEWDGRDGGGRSVGAGVYLARLVAGEARSTARLVVVR
jgi:flagellar hook assembly protein FlgD